MHELLRASVPESLVQTLGEKSLEGAGSPWLVRDSRGSSPCTLNGVDKTRTNVEVQMAHASDKHRFLYLLSTISLGDAGSPWSATTAQAKRVGRVNHNPFM